MADVGHNGGPSASPTKMAYFQANIVQFRDGIRTLKADQRGVYLSVLLEIYDTMGPIKADPKRISIATGIDARLIARVLPELVDMGKIYLTDGWIHNSRAEKEIGDYVKNHQRLSSVAKYRESVKREKRSISQSEVDELKKQLTEAVAAVKASSASTPPQTKPQVSESKATAKADVSETSPRTLGEEYKKDNKINGCGPETCQSSSTTRAREELRIKNKESKKEERCGRAIESDLGEFNRSGGVSVSALPEAFSSADDHPNSEIEGLNGATFDMVEQLAICLNQLNPDKATARVLLRDECRAFGPEAVKSAHADLLRKVGQGELKRPSIRTFSAFVKQASRSNADSRSNSKHVPREEGVSFLEMVERDVERLASEKRKFPR